MVIKFALITHNTSDSSKEIYWFEVKIPQYPWTSICIGFNEQGEWVSSSSTFYELDKETQEKAIAEVKELFTKVTK